MKMYHLVTKWFFQAPIEKVWDEIADLNSWPTWWQDFKKATIRGTEAKLQLGSLADCEVRGALPYTLRFSLEVSAFQPPTLMELKSSGDLMGNGKWVLEHQSDGTAVTYYWDVGITIPMLNLLGKLPITEAMMKKNHDDVMDKGYRLLKIKLEG